jgi:hypothetical protein
VRVEDDESGHDPVLIEQHPKIPRVARPLLVPCLGRQASEYRAAKSRAEHHKSEVRT